MLKRIVAFVPLCFLFALMGVLGAIDFIFQTDILDTVGDNIVDKMADIHNWAVPE